VTPAELRHEIIVVASELCRYQSKEDSGVYVRKSVVNGDACQFAVRLKRIIDKFCPPQGKK
jgi:hypothetical protein